MGALNTSKTDIALAIERLRVACFLLVTVVLGGSTGYYAIGQGKWSLLDCVYMTIITLTTVGYGEILPIQENPVARGYTIVLLLMGMGAVLYFASTVTAFVIDGDLRRMMKEREIRRKIGEMENHTILCGAGKTGLYVLQELLQSRSEVVLVDKEREHVEHLIEEVHQDLNFVIGDATEDAVLIEAGVERCKAVIVTLGDDHDSLLCTISVRTLNPAVRIIAQGSNARSEQKFRRAGANEVVYTSVIGGTRIANEVLRPHVVTFLDVMMRDHDHQMRIEQIELGERSPLVGLPLRRSGLRDEGNILVVAILDRRNNQYTYNPKPDFTLMAIHTLIVMGEIDTINAIRARIEARQGAA